MAEKKYYFLKLETDYFGTKEIKKLRRVAGGDTFTIIYLKMQLRSLENNGILIYEGIEDDFPKELASDLNEKEEDVKMTLAFLQANNMIEQVNDYEFFLNRVPETITSETAAAKRMRLYRQRKEREEKRNKVTSLLQPVTERYTDIDIEQDIDINIDKDICTEHEVSVPEKMQAEKIFISLPLNDKTEHEVKESEIYVWKELYPAVNIEQQLRNMKGWLMSNPAKRKTRKGINRFINSWLSREQDKGFKPQQPKNNQSNPFLELLQEEFEKEDKR